MAKRTVMVLLFVSIAAVASGVLGAALRGTPSAGSELADAGSSASSVQHGSAPGQQVLARASIDWGEELAAGATESGSDEDENGSAEGDSTGTVEASLQPSTPADGTTEATSSGATESPPVDSEGEVDAPAQKATADQAASEEAVAADGGDDEEDEEEEEEPAAADANAEEEQEEESAAADANAEEEEEPAAADADVEEEGEEPAAKAGDADEEEPADAAGDAGDTDTHGGAAEEDKTGKI